MTLQRVNNELAYILPLDFAGFTVWSSANNGVPAYIIVYAEDPERKPLMVKLQAGREMNYTPGAFWGYNLGRMLRQSGYIDVAFAQSLFMLDDKGQAWWVTTTYKPTIMWSGERTNGVLVTDPATGATTWYALKDAPAWAERISRDFVRNYIAGGAISPAAGGTASGRTRALRNRKTVGLSSCTGPMIVRCG